MHFKRISAYKNHINIGKYHIASIINVNNFSILATVTISFLFLQLFTTTHNADRRTQKIHSLINVRGIKTIMWERCVLYTIICYECSDSTNKRRRRRMWTQKYVKQFLLLISYMYVILTRLFLFTLALK